MRGDIHRLKPFRSARGHEQQGARYGIILQSDHLPLSTVLVAPTSTSSTPVSFRPFIRILGNETMVMVEQTAAVDVESRLGEYVGHLSFDEMRAVERALRAVLALD
jgi:mRNA interferase MazF